MMHETPALTEFMAGPCQAEYRNGGKAGPAAATAGRVADTAPAHPETTNGAY